MFTLLISIAVIAALYGFVWHNKPAREREVHPREDPKHKPGGAPFSRQSDKGA